MKSLIVEFGGNCLYSLILTIVTQNHTLQVLITSELSKMVEEIASLDTILSDSFFPKDLNKTKIMDIFEILKSQDRPDLVEEMKKKASLLLKLSRKITDINAVLPTEILKKILKNLTQKDLGFVKQTCKRWKEITDVFELRKQASSKIE